MVKIIEGSNLKIKEIGFCYRGKDKELEYAYLVLNNGGKIVSTVSYVSDEGLTIGDYLQGRIEDFNYCVKNRQFDVLNAEFEFYEEGYHSINKTNINGVTFEKVW